ncbi:alpha/beta hydrolase [Nocardia bovistercoris]|uniref:Esterase family protein n=1 Tax=Nocardia bovistercoris TaxID=2785916 RepID=A0A931N552_9NOCA|nr:alpha/beta hydrolase family protein [Nocardia bovistercoris]MBH0779001.1 esterase family protein [Nocardia bovistercoris]
MRNTGWTRGSAGRSRWVGRLAAAAALALLAPLGITGHGATASAALDPGAFDFWVDSGMGPIKTRILRAADGNTDRVVYVLDGMRAPETLNGWEIETNVPRVLADWNINVVMPVGGMSSFYADWNAPSEFFGIPAGSGSSTGSGGLNGFAAGPGKSYRYQWESFLVNDLRAALRDRLGFSSYRNGVFGLSMGGSAALTLAAYHPDQFSFAGAYSGYLNISAPGMREAIRVAMLDAGGYNVDAMAPPWGPQWLRMDPFVFAPNLVRNGTRLWVAAASGLPTSNDPPSFTTLNGMALEALALANTRAFQVRMATLGGGNVVYDFPAFGIHAWSNWQDEAYRMIPDLSANIG